jgi:hypothetical protein
VGLFLFRLWHDEADRNASPAMGRYLAGIIPNCKASFYPGEGHFSLLANQADEILEELVPG